MQRIVHNLGIALPIATQRPWRIVVQQRVGMNPLNPKKRHCVVQCWTEGFAVWFDLDQHESFGPVTNDDIRRLTSFMLRAAVAAWESR